MIYIAHLKGHPLMVKTNRGVCAIAFASQADGLAFLGAGLPGAQSDTVEEILAINPQAFPPSLRLLHLATKELIDAFKRDPQSFPTEQHLITVRLPASSQTKPASPPDAQQNEFGF
jgi:hypothetical protein